MLNYINEELIYILIDTRVSNKGIRYYILYSV